MVDVVFAAVCAVFVKNQFCAHVLNTHSVLHVLSDFHINEDIKPYIYDCYKRCILMLWMSTIVWMAAQV